MPVFIQSKEKNSTLMACLPTYRHRLPGTNSIRAPDRAGQSPSNQKPSHNLNTILNLHKYTVSEQQERTRSTRREVWTSGQLQHIPQGGSPPAGKQRRAGRSWNGAPCSGSRGGGRWPQVSLLRAIKGPQCQQAPGLPLLFELQETCVWPAQSVGAQPYTGVWWAHLYPVSSKPTLY